MSSILSRLRQLVPDFRFARRAPAVADGPRRPRPDEDEKLPNRYGGGGSGGGGHLAERIWFLPFLDNSTGDTAEIRSAMRLMVRDPYVKTAWWSQVLGVLAQPFQVHPPKGDKSRQSQDNADFVRHCLETVDGGMLGVGQAVLTNLGSDGYSLAEKVWHTEARGKYAHRVTLRALKPKDLEDNGGRLVGDRFNNVTGVESTRTSETFPITDFTYVRYLHTFDEPMGMAAFRPSYGAYWMRDTVRKLRTIHKEKLLDGLLVGTFEDPADKGPLELALQRARSSTWLSIPKGVMIESVSKSQASESDFKSFDESLREEILVGIAFAHLHILQGGVSDGRGNTKIHKEVAELGPWLLTYLLQHVINRQIIPDVLDYNLPLVTGYPTVSLGGVTNQEVLEILQVLQGAQAAGFKPSKTYYATELSIQEADPNDPDDQLTPAPPAGGDPFGGMGGGMGGFGADPATDPFGGFNESGGFERFAWADWKQVDGGKWKSPGGRVLSDPVYQRLKGAGGAKAGAAPKQAGAAAIAAKPAVGRREHPGNGAIVEDKDGTPYLVMGARHGVVNVAPIVNGKAVVNATDAVSFVVDPARTPASPRSRKEPLFKTGRNYFEEAKAEEPPPPPPADAFRPLDASGVKLPPMRTATLVSLQKASTRFDVYGLGRDTGWWTNLQAAVLMPPAEHEKYKGAVAGRVTGGRQPPIDGVFPKRYSPEPAAVAGFRKAASNDEVDMVMFADPVTGDRAAIDAKYYALVTKRHPKATFRTSGPAASHRPVVAVQDGKPVGLVMPIRVDALDRTAVSDYADRNLFTSIGGADPGDSSGPGPGLFSAFAWSEWQQIDGGRWKSPGGRVLSDPVYQRLKASRSAAPAAGGADARTSPAAAPDPKTEFEAADRELQFAASEFVKLRPAPEQVQQAWAAATPDLPPQLRQQLGDRLTAAASAATPEQVAGGFRGIAQWVARLPVRLAGLAVRGLWALAKHIAGNMAGNVYHGLIRPPIDMAKSAAAKVPTGLKILGVLATSAGLLAASAAVPALLPVGLAAKVAIGGVLATGSSAAVYHGLPRAVRAIQAKARGFAEAGSETALAGPHGKRAAELMTAAQTTGREVLAKLTEAAVGRLLKEPNPLAAAVLFDDTELKQIADSLSATTATADLLGRARVRRLAEAAQKRGQGRATFAEPDDPFAVFEESPPALPPVQAADYFRRLVPTLGIDPKRFGPLFDRQAFTLAVAADDVLLQKVKQVIQEQISRGSRPEAVADIRQALDEAGVTPRNPQYAEAVYRTNMNDSFLQGQMSEMADPVMQEIFPAWEYHAIVDGRARATHAARNTKLFPSHVSFAEVRGTEAGDVINCRCSFSPVHRGELAARLAAGDRLGG